ncbi:MAG: PhzF family phenazine biosynthesis protein [Firmicutes bacterium HGW-Firmicutes-16]|nr:MAG: PhzF family phenazine biosynthesis protein [Firmicutes bacterium HGW-Firmicutes-16]
MERYCYKKIDAFTSGKSLGNPAACIYLNDNQTLTDEEMLTIAKQHKGFVSEVVFCSKLGSFEYMLIYFSSECEVDFCGHGTIACMYSLIKETPNLLSQKEIVIQTNKKGILTVFNDIAEKDAIYISAPQPKHLGTALNSQIISQYLQIDSKTISITYPIDIIDAGLRPLIIPIATLEEEINIFPDELSIKEFCVDNEIDIILIFSLEVKDKNSIAHTRVFAPKFGYLEDPATGSGNSAFGYYMLKNGIWSGNAISIEQGGVDRIFNTVRLSLNDNKVIFGGSATTRIQGEYYL